MVCAFASIILGVSFCSLSGRGHTQYLAGIMAKVSALLFYLFNQCFDSKQH